MEIKLKLFNQTARFEEHSVIGNEEIVVKLDKKLQPNIEYFAKSSNIEKPIEIINGVFKVENKPAFYDFVIYATKNGDILKEWKTDGLIIKQLDSKNELSGEVVKTAKELKALVENQNNEIASLRKEFELLKNFVFEINGLKGKVK